MKTLCAVIFLTLLLTASAGAQQARREPVPLPSEFQTQATEVMQKLYKLRGNYAEAISLFREYEAKRDALMAQLKAIAIDGATAAHMTKEQLDNSSFVVDGRGVCRWVPKPDATASEPLPAFPVNEDPETNEQKGATYTVKESDGYTNILHLSAEAVRETLAQFPKGWYYDVVNRGKGPVTILPASSINGVTSFTLAPGKSIRIFSTGNEYRTVDFNGRN